jgi:hypothetical protein
MSTTIKAEILEALSKLSAEERLNGTTRASLAWVRNS